MHITFRREGRDLFYVIPERLCEDPNREFEVHKDGKNISVKDVRGNEAPKLACELMLKLDGQDSVESAVVKGCTIHVRVREGHSVRAAHSDAVAIISNVFNWFAPPLVVSN